ncbi:hypothetical protein CRP01_36520 [Flavilitoribacter nigricans DSM 23189 = NBRC 102662]|uniref:Uncharacterized protein n=1 Tax=Flavilitoribacter nigricans (strain ATCC 23147 / DSM 23189 / NBRC 102662 / NCIMB 1420 / SS-2) TaxID=1122177 RepID=A0A2D0MZG2_FLAN2|nr:hypothetical protein CRP01_36520 [Flavilitoribacter nigricans DSM 23189 = NBRC 102662]
MEYPWVIEHKGRGDRYAVTSTNPVETLKFPTTRTASTDRLAHFRHPVAERRKHFVPETAIAYAAG